MSVGHARTAAIIGLRAVLVDVEAHVGGGLPSFNVIGSSDAAARQAADRVKTALAATGVTLPQRRVLVSLAPAEVPKAGARYDLAMAVAVLAQLGVLGERALIGTALIGELALDGEVRPVPGVLPSAAALPSAGVGRLLVPEANAPEAALVPGLETVPVRHLSEAIAILAGEARPRAVTLEPDRCAGHLPDLADVRGQAMARRALEIAAAGGHHLLLIGPPGCGKSMLARRLPSVLPPLSHAEALEVAAVRSVSGAASPRGGPVLDRRPPFRAPHHSVSAAALLGGGSGIARPGELSRAHRGCLFLDELFEWPRRLLDALREPLEEGEVRVARSQATVTYPARVLLVAAANPCPCGGRPGCACTDEEIWSYQRRLSGPLADRLDLAPTVVPLSRDDLVHTTGGEPSAAVAARVAGARQIARDRWERGTCNAEVPVSLVRPTVDPVALGSLARAVESGELTGRGYDRSLRVARTIADLDASGRVTADHVAEARMHRGALRAPARAVPA